MRYRGDVLYRADLEAVGLEGPDGSLASGARPLHPHLDLAHAVLGHLLGYGLGRLLRRIRRALARAFEADRPGARPGDRVALRIRDIDYGVVERRLDVRDPVGDVL